MAETRPSNRSQPQRPRRSTGARRSSANRRAAGAALYVVAVLGVSVLLAAIAWVFAGDVLALNKSPHTAIITLSPEIFSEEEVTVETEGPDGETVEETRTVKRADMGEVASILKENDLIEFKTLFKIFASFTGSGKKIAPGTYELNTDMDYRAIISSMSAGSASRSEISVTIPEGYSIDQIFSLLEEKGVATAADLRQTAADHDYQFDFLEGIPLGDYHRLEGYLFPDTYRFYMGEDPLYAINKMLVNFTNMVSRETRDSLEAEGRDLHQIIIVASLIEKETDGTDQALIASVIYNRLNNPSVTNGYLQIDATLAYLNGGKVPTEADKSIDSPYNTYLYTGLPAGPISNPGSEAIWAAMNPKDSNYYYYALGTDGLHHYSKTYSEHQAFLNSLPKN